MKSKKVNALIKLRGLDLFFPIIISLGPWSGETLKNGRPKVILIASYSNKVFIGVNTWSWYIPIITLYFSLFFFKKIVSAANGPFSADSFFLKRNIENYDVVVGMYHDQVLTPIKTLFNFFAINITIGLPFLRITPDHGPNSDMLGKNKSDPSSFFYAMKFIENIK